MYVKQAFSLLFFLRHGKRNKKSGKTPMYFRLKIDGASVDRCVKGVSLLPDRWDTENRIVKTDERQHKAFNGSKPINTIGCRIRQKKRYLHIIYLK